MHFKAKKIISRGGIIRIFPVLLGVNMIISAFIALTA
jgi:hypothetical protein